MANKGTSPVLSTLLAKLKLSSTMCEKMKKEKLFEGKSMTLLPLDSQEYSILPPRSFKSQVETIIPPQIRDIRLKLSD